MFLFSDCFFLGGGWIVSRIFCFAGVLVISCFLSVLPLKSLYIPIHLRISLLYVIILVDSYLLA